MASHFISIGNNNFHYEKIGEQKHAWLIWHGFSQNCQSFLPAFEDENKSETIISIDLPFHGKTDFKDSLFTLEHIEALIQALVTKHQLESISLFGFSIGGKMVLSYLQKERPLVKQVVLAASDGFYTDPYFYFSTQHFIGTKLFKYFISNPDKIIKMSKYLYKVGFISKSKWKFAHQNLQQQQHLALVGKMWPAVKDIKVDTQLVLENLKKSTTQVLVIIGKFDKILKPKSAEDWVAKLPQGKLLKLPTGHNFIKPNILSAIKKAIQEF